MSADDEDEIDFSSLFNIRVTIQDPEGTWNGYGTLLDGREITYGVKSGTTVVPRAGANPVTRTRHTMFVRDSDGDDIDSRSVQHRPDEHETTKWAGSVLLQYISLHGSGLTAPTEMIRSLANDAVA